MFENIDIKQKNV